MSIAFVEHAEGASVKALTKITHATIRDNVAPSP